MLPYAFVDEALKASMGCKQYARMLGLSRGYPHILYLDLNKWDAHPCPNFSTAQRSPSIEKTTSKEIRVTRREVAPPGLTIIPIFLSPLHACITALAEERRFISESEIGKPRLVSRGHFSTAESMAT
jgi:hypothetical protein